MVSERGGRLDVEEAARGQGRDGRKGGYVLYDPHGDDDRVAEGEADHQVQLRGHGEGWRHSANVPGMRITISDVAVNFEKPVLRVPLLGMSTTRYRITDYKIAMKVAIVEPEQHGAHRSEYWMAIRRSASPIRSHAWEACVWAGAGRSTS